MDGMLATLVPLLLLIAIMYFLLIRPQKKREKDVTNMRNAIKVGDEVITIGGICGKIVKTKEDVLTIQVGSDKTKFDVMRWSISKVVSEGSNTSVKKIVKESAEDIEETDDNIEEPKKTLPKRMKRKAEDVADEAVENVASEVENIESTEADVEAPQTEAEASDDEKAAE